MFSIYIPRVFSNITKERMIAVFEEKAIGRVSSIDLVAKLNASDEMYNTAYVHFEFWYDNAYSNKIQNKLCEGEKVKIIYDHPWYWIVLKNTSVKKEPSERKQRIDLNGASSISVSLKPSSETEEVLFVEEENEVIDHLVEDDYVSLVEQENSMLHVKIQLLEDHLLHFQKQIYLLQTQNMNLFYNSVCERLE